LDFKTYHFVGKSRQTGGDPAAFPPWLRFWSVEKIIMLCEGTSR